MERLLQILPGAHAACALVVAGALSSGASAQTGTPVQWRTADGGNGHWYAQIAYGGGKTYPQAKALCESLAGHPVTITGPGEQGVVCSVMTVLTAWIGAERGPAGWGWCTGEAWTFGSICSPTPNADRIQLYGCNCWNDTFDGDSITQAVIVEWSADCNNDGEVDFGQIRAGGLVDADGNNVPDCCESPIGCCPGDVNGDRMIDGADIGSMLGYWGEATEATPTTVDINRDGVVNGADLGILLSRWGTCLQ